MTDAELNNGAGVLSYPNFPRRLLRQNNINGKQLFTSTIIAYGRMA